MMKILFTGGGTGGHIFPIIAIKREIKRLQLQEYRPDFDFFYCGPEDSFSSALLSKEGIKIKTIFSGKLRRYWGLRSVILNLIDVIFKIPLGVIQSFFYIFFLAPDLIFSKGGYGSLPVVIAGWFLQTPIFLHESDIAPGASNKILSKLALEIFISFPKTEYFHPGKMILVGNPIRKEILSITKEKSGKKPLLLILGGSQGAQRINDMLLSGLSKILDKFEVIHQCGEKNFEQVKAESKVVLTKELEKYYHLVPFLKEPELCKAYAVSEWIIARAGSGTIFEIAALGKPSILIPLPSAAQRHQTKNAYAYARAGAALVIEEPNLDPLFVLERLVTISNSPSRMKKMSERAKEFSKPEAAKVIAGYIIDYLC
jgi:UDP-N-acetylglucosamine--N-acetylmuramyl-(pentapeptide) pyrophosphoryl-undecaprenol N-acetylglucosamine transferase